MSFEENFYEDDYDSSYIKYVNNDYWGYADTKKTPSGQIGGKSKDHSKSDKGGEGYEPITPSPFIPLTEDKKMSIYPKGRYPIPASWKRKKEWETKTQHPDYKPEYPSGIMNPIGPANKSPIDNIVQGIGDWWNNALHGPNRPIGMSPMPQGQTVAPTIIEPIGFATRQKSIPYSEWAPQMWQHLGEVANNFTDTNSFAAQIRRFLAQIPCPECKTDGVKYLQTNPPEVCKSQTDASKWVSDYHQHVDKVAKGWGYSKLKCPPGSVLTLSGDPTKGHIAECTKRGSNLQESEGIQYYNPYIPSSAHRLVEPHEAITNPGRIEIRRGIDTSRSQPGGVGPMQRVTNAFGRDPVVEWEDLHDLSENFNPDTFASDVYYNVDKLTCPRCKAHSLMFIQKNPPERVMSRDQALYWMCKFHNWASIDAGNGQVDCGIDPEGYGYESGHDFDRGFYFSGRGGGKGGGHGGGQQRGGRRGRGHGGMQQQQNGDDNNQWQGRRGGRMGRGRG